MKTRILHTKIWQDSFFTELAAADKLLFIYYLTNENVNIIGCYECPDRKVCFDTGIDTPKIRLFQEKAQKAGRLFFKDNYVFLKNFSKYESYTGDFNDRGKNTLIKQLSRLIKDWYEECLRGVYIPTINNKQEIINKKEEVVKGKQILEDSGFISNLENLFPDKDIPFEIEKMKDWLSSSGKTKKDYAAFARNWLRSPGDKRNSGLQEVIIRPPTEVQA